MAASLTMLCAYVLKKKREMREFQKNSMCEQKGELKKHRRTKKNTGETNNKN